jgi:hypothetical protein
MSSLSKLFWLGTALTLAACNNEKGADTALDDGGVDSGLPGDEGSGGDDTGEPRGEWAFSLIGPGSVQAGEDAVLTLTLTAPDGSDASGEAEVSIAPTPSASVSIDGLAVSATVTGEYELAVEVTAQGEVFSETLSLTVTPGDPGAIDLVLPESTVPAGTVVTPSWTVTDDYGNEISDAEVLLAVSPDGVAVVGDTLETGPAGNYYVTAQVDGTSVFETEPLQVVAGAVASLDLVLEALDAEVGDTLEATVIAADAWGNPLEATDALITVEPSDGAVVSGMDITFDAEGYYDVTATYDKLSDTEGPVTVDSSGPFIVVDSHDRAEYLEDGGTITLTGSITDEVTGLATAALNGRALSVDSDGNFSVDVVITEGTDFVEIEAEDNDGNTADLKMAFLQGEFLEDGETLDDLIDIFISQDGLSTLGSVVASQIDLETIEDELIASNPVATRDFSSICFGFGDAYLEIDFESMSYGDFDVDMRSSVSSGGGLMITVTVEDIVIDLDGDYAYCFGNNTLNSQITADEAEIEVYVTATVNSSGEADVRVLSTDVTFTNFATDFDSLNTLVDILNYLSLDLESIVQDYAEQALVDAVEAEVPPLTEDLLSQFLISQEFDLGGATVDLDARLRDLDFGSDGLTLYLEGEVTPSSVDGDIPDNPGSLLINDDRPGFNDDPAPDLELALSLDALNRVLHGAWEAGAFSLTLDNEDLGLDASLIGGLFEGATTLEMFVYPQLPPTLSAGTGAGLFDLALGELMIDAYGEVDGTYSFLGTLSVHATGEVDVVLDGDMLEMVTDNVVASFDVHVSSADEVAWAESLETILDAFAGKLTSGLIPEVSFEIPAIAGITLTPEEVDAVSISDEWVGVKMSIEE